MYLENVLLMQFCISASSKSCLLLMTHYHHDHTINTFNMYNGMTDVT